MQSPEAPSLCGPIRPPETNPIHGRGFSKARHRINRSYSKEYGRFQIFELRAERETLDATPVTFCATASFSTCTNFFPAFFFRFWGFAVTTTARIARASPGPATRTLP